MNFKKLLTPSNIAIGAGLLTAGYFVYHGLPTEHGGYPHHSYGGVRALVAQNTMMYKGTGKIINGSGWYKAAQACWKMASGGCRASVRHGIYKTHNSTPACVPYMDMEIQAYVNVGPVAPNQKGTGRTIMTGGGPGQSGMNCCVYSVGVENNTGKLMAEEEGPHDKHEIYQFPISGGAVSNIGPVNNRIIGLKEVIIRTGGTVKLEGYVDKDNNGTWAKFLDMTNPKGGSLPVITKPCMGGDCSCQEFRIRCDNRWPVDIDRARSWIAEIAIPAVKTGGAGTPIVTGPTVAAPTVETKTAPDSKAVPIKPVPITTPTAPAPAPAKASKYSHIYSSPYSRFSIA